MPTHASYASEISNQLDDFRKRAQEAASKQSPATDATVLDSNEAQLLSEGDKWISTEQRIFDATITEASRAVNDTYQRSIELRNKIDQVLNSATLLSDVDAELAAERDDLIKSTENLKLVETDWRYFRATQRITQQASYPESKVKHFSLVAVLALVETVMNAFFYENAGGLAGGFIVALGVAAVNMTMALFLGMGFRHINLFPTASKTIGWSCLGFFVATTLFCNMLFSAFRSEYQTLTDTSDFNQLRHAFTVAMQAAIKIFLLEPRFTDLLSFILFFIGIILSFIAFREGYTSDDKHPGYGDLDRRLKKAQADETQLQGRVRETLRARLQQSIAELTELIKRPTSLIADFGQRRALLMHARQTLATQVAAIRREFKLVIEARRVSTTLRQSVKEFTEYRRLLLLVC